MERCLGCNRSITIAMGRYCSYCNSSRLKHLTTAREQQIEKKRWNALTPEEQQAEKKDRKVQRKQQFLERIKNMNDKDFEVFLSTHELGKIYRMCHFTDNEPSFLRGSTVFISIGIFFFLCILPFNNEFANFMRIFSVLVVILGFILKYVKEKSTVKKPTRDGFFEFLSILDEKELEALLKELSRGITRDRW